MQDSPSAGRVIAVSICNPGGQERGQLCRGVEGVPWERGGHIGRTGDTPGETWK